MRQIVTKSCSRVSEVGNGGGLQRKGNQKRAAAPKICTFVRDFYKANVPESNRSTDKEELNQTGGAIPPCKSDPPVPPTTPL